MILIGVTSICLALLLVVPPTASNESSAQISIANAQGNTCTTTQVAAAVSIELETWRPQRVIVEPNVNRTDGRVDNIASIVNSAPNKVDFDPPILIESVGLGCKQDHCHHHLDFYYQGQLVESGVGLRPDTRRRTEAHVQDFKSRPGGGVLVDHIEAAINNGQTGVGNPIGTREGRGAAATYIKFTIEKQTINLPVSLNDQQVVSIGDLKTLIGSAFIDNSGQTDPNLRVRQFATVTVTGPATFQRTGQNSQSFTVNNLDDNFASIDVVPCKDSLGGSNNLCDANECSVPQSANCDDGIDNDGDGKIDFPEDPGCTSSSDGDETDPPTSRPVTLPGSSGQLVTVDGSLYPVGIISGSANEIYAKVRVGSGFEMLRMTPTPLPSTTTNDLQNGSVHYYLLQGEDSTGKGHIVVTQGRHWDPSTFSDSTLTPEPWFSLFANANGLQPCASHIKQQFTSNPIYLSTAFGFQQIIEALALCQQIIPTP